MIKISDELLSEVLKQESLNIEVAGKYIKYVQYENSHEGMLPCDYRINIYELAHKCKEWVKEQKYKIITENRDYGTEYIIINKNDTIFGEYEILHSDYAKTEQQAIFNVCQWILDNKGTK